MPEPTPPPSDAVPEGAVGDNALSETAPDPDSPLRKPGAPELPEGVIGEDAVDRVIQGHTYDGIREYDNPMPGWWVALFWAGIVFAPIYMLGVHVFDWINDYGDDYAQAGARLEEVRAVYAATGPSFKTDAGALREYAADAQMAEAGAADFAAICAACHGDAGQGVIGPNLTDDYWIHGADVEQIWTSIAEGFPAQGMPPMKDQLDEEARAQVLAYVYALQGTDPPGAKAPEGEPATATL
ncbi:cbb3-type cytochrome c oxidase N-terminal domain-containing protein [Rubrivirga litoralis]|uniref:Cbb3-type cytochrome c oxidase N-terminal domain-containing protein n=1 Tax=Rubrivirga litoralis TaxID=3075598 RepID=A0ABU3BNF6_9BACT|nr:cbb3-type cytochrome c oxidase N-terminal domain-containing protein [Rubrivirga sp. F394]MDT0630842.1 cbb3-type cytochrome c oxidase N-terminal domain-containing protein [Rubrivirga sp. F394]